MELLYFAKFYLVFLKDKFRDRLTKKMHSKMVVLNSKLRRNVRPFTLVIATG